MNKPILLSLLATIFSLIDLSLTLNPLQTILTSTAPPNSVHSHHHHAQYLLLTAVTHDPSPPHHSRLQCLNTTRTWTPYPTVGQSVFLGSMSNATYVILPPESAEGWHRPPHPMLFVLLSGLAHVRTPSTGDEVWISDRNPVVLALDTRGKGHLTYYPGKEETHALQVPLGDLDEFNWVVVKEGPCS